jgi:hypothetical protein
MRTRDVPEVDDLLADGEDRGKRIARRFGTSYFRAASNQFPGSRCILSDVISERYTQNPCLIPLL